jgi:hypothetical protein
MANVVFNGIKLPQSELKDIQQEIYADWGTFRDRDIDIQDGHKSGTQVYETKITVSQSAYSSGPVTTQSNTFTVDRSPVSLTQIMYEGTLDHNTLRDTRFERSMAKGTFNRVSSEHDNYTLQYLQPAISQDMESKLWNGATSAKKTLVAAMTAGAAQGSISAGAQTLVAAMPTNLWDSIPAIILNNNSQSKSTNAGANGIGDYVKVPSIAGSVTAANIAAEYDKIYQLLDMKLVLSPDKTEVPVIYAPLNDFKLIQSANNSVGASSNKNFEIVGAGKSPEVYYQGVQIKFKPLVGFRIASPPKFIKLLMDLQGDMSEILTGEVANGAQQRWYKNAQTVATWVTNQRYIVLYGG